MRFDPLKRFQEDMSGTIGRVVVNVCGYLFTALILAGLLSGQGLTWSVFINTTLALLFLVFILRRPAGKGVR